MIEEHTISKPYAVAAYEFAKDNDVVAEWGEFLRKCAAFIREPEVEQSLKNPFVSQENLLDVFFEVLLDSEINEYVINFLKVIAHNKRISLITDIEKIFSELNNKDANVKQALVILAYEVDELFLKSLREKLEKKFECSLELSVKIDSKIIGGVIVEIDGMLIDDSIVSNLKKIQNSMLLQK